MAKWCFNGECFTKIVFNGVNIGSIGFNGSGFIALPKPDENILPYDYLTNNGDYLIDTQGFDLNNYKIILTVYNSITTEKDEFAYIQEDEIILEVDIPVEKIFVEGKEECLIGGGKKEDSLATFTLGIDGFISITYSTGKNYQKLGDIVGSGICVKNNHVWNIGQIKKIEIIKK